MHMLISRANRSLRGALGPSKGSVETEKKYLGAVPEEVTSGKEASSNGSGILDIDLRWNTGCNLSN